MQSAQLYRLKVNGAGECVLWACAVQVSVFGSGELQSFGERGGDSFMNCMCVDVSVKSSEIIDRRPMNHRTSN